MALTLSVNDSIQPFCLALSNIPSVPVTSKPRYSFNWNADISLQLSEAISPNDFIGGVIVTEPSPTNPFIVFSSVVLIPPFENGHYGTLVDLSFSLLNSNYHFLYERELNPLDSVIQLTASTVPASSAVTLFCSGILGLFVANKRKIN